MKIRIAVSACLIGQNCNFDGKDLLSSFIVQLSVMEDIELVPICPEHSVFGTPRANMRIVGGDGYDVLDGRATVVNAHEADVTSEHLRGAWNFLEILKQKKVEYAILMEGSPSCGSNVILQENAWPKGGFKRGVGVACALLRRNGIKVMGGFDHKTVADFLSTLGKEKYLGTDLMDLKDMPKFQDQFRFNQ